ncbi:hypothetical protein ES703_21830 [subsurface metagenome]
MQDVNPAELLNARLDHFLTVARFGDIGLEGDALAAFLVNHFFRFLGGLKIVVDRHYLGAFPCEDDGCRFAVAHTGKHGTGSGNNGHFAFQSISHGKYSSLTGYFFSDGHDLWV